MSEIIATDKIIKLLVDDDIKRNKYLFNFIKIVCRTSENQIVSVNGDWGSGKTYFINKLNCLINYFYLFDDQNNKKENNLYSNYSDFSEANLDTLRELASKNEYKEFAAIVRNNNINSIYFNAWKHDDEDDPILSIIGELLKKYDLDKYEKILNADVINLFNIFSKIKYGVSFESSNEKENICSQIETKEKIQEKIKNILDNLICENCDRLIIFIDELDRCNPIYALRLLERIKHYFTDKRLTIVISTNLVELTNIVNSVYGNNFSSSKYLEKFFDLYLELPKVDLKTYINIKETNIKTDPNAYLSLVEMKFIEYSNLQMRQIDKYTNCMKYIENNIMKKDLFMRDHIDVLLDFLFIPYAMGLYITDSTLYNKFSNGNGWSEFEKFIKSNNNLIDICMSYIYNKTYNDRSQDELFSELKKLYDFIFNPNTDSYVTYIPIGDDNILSNSFKRIYDNMSLLGDLADFS